MSTQAVPEQFTGYAAVNEEDGKALNLTKIQYTPKKWTEADVDIKISHCGICGSCIHTLTNGWPSPTAYPCVAGHEVVGIVVRAGKKSGHSVGERVGVGAQGGSCGECDMCRINKENYCARGMQGTYQGRYPEDPENHAQGGYADYIRCQGRFAIPIPEQIKSAEAAPLMCAGATVYSPLKRFGAGPGKRVAVVGIGGLGHLALQFSNALGAETFALSHSESKLTDAEKLGIEPENFIITKDEKATAKKWARSFDLIVCTAFQDDMPIESLFLRLLRPEGTLALCGLPESKLPAMYGHAFVGKGVTLAGTLIAGTTQIKEMLDVTAEKNVRPWIQVRPMSDASQAVKDMDRGKARYRFVLEN